MTVMNLKTWRLIFRFFFVPELKVQIADREASYKWSHNGKVIEDKGQQVCVCVCVCVCVGVCVCVCVFFDINGQEAKGNKKSLKY